MKISIVTPSFNQCRFLKLTLGSILSQQGPFEVESLVMDGGSTDGTVDLLRETSQRDPRLIWLSEKDKGQSDALQKGLARATGDLIGWINSDDVYTPGTFAAVAEAFAARPDAQWLVGRCQIIDAEGREIRPWITRYKDRLLRRYTFGRLLRENPICQPSVFWRRAFGEAVGGPDVSLHHAMDYDLWLRMGKRSEPIVLDRVVSQFRIHGQSKTGTKTRERFDEHVRVAARHAEGHRGDLLLNRLHTEKTVLAYRLMWLLGMGGGS